MLNHAGIDHIAALVADWIKRQIYEVMDETVGENKFYQFAKIENIRKNNNKSYHIITASYNNKSRLENIETESVNSLSLSNELLL